MEAVAALIILFGALSYGLDSEEKVEAPVAEPASVDQVKVVTGGDKIQYGRKVKYWVPEAGYYITDLSVEPKVKVNSTPSSNPDVVVDPAEEWSANSESSVYTSPGSRYQAKSVGVKWLEPGDPELTRMTRPRLVDEHCEGETQTVFTADLKTSRPDKSVMRVSEVVIGCG